MTTIVSTFDRSSSVRGSLAPGGAGIVPATQEHSPATRPRAAAKVRSSGGRDTGVVFMHASLNRGAATCVRWRLLRSLECPGGADRQSVGVAVLRTDALVLGAKRESPGFGLHSHAVSE